MTLRGWRQSLHILPQLLKLRMCSQHSQKYVLNLMEVLGHLAQTHLRPSEEQSWVGRGRLLRGPGVFLGKLVLELVGHWRSFP